MPNILDIIIPTYNTPDEYLKRALSSINIQKNIDFKDINVIIVDDKSKGVFNKSIFKQFPKLNISFIKNEKNMGPGPTRQNGVDNSTSKYFTFLDSDDVFTANSLGTVVNILKNNDVNYVFTKFIMEDRYGSKEVLDYKAMLCLHGLFINRSFVNKYNLRFNDHIRYHDDTYYVEVLTKLEHGSSLDLVTYEWLYNSNSLVNGKKDLPFIVKSYGDYSNATIEACEFLFDIKNNDKSLYPDFFKTMIKLYIILASNKFMNYEYKSKYEEEWYNKYIIHKDVFDFAESLNIDINKVIEVSLESVREIDSEIEIVEDYNSFMKRLSEGK